MEASDMGAPIQLQGVSHICSETLPFVKATPMTEIESMEQRKATTMKNGDAADLITSYLVCEECGVKIAISYIEVK